MLLVDEILRTLGERITRQLKEDIEKKRVTPFGAVNATGQLRDSVRYEVNGGILRVYALDYIFYLEHGRKPNKNQDPKAIRKFVGWAGSTFIKDWVQAKGIAANPYSIAYKIARKGTTAFLQGGTDLVSGLVNEQMIEGLRSDLFEAIIQDTVSSFRSNVLKMAA